jgi:hypothetical protein
MPKTQGTTLDDDSHQRASRAAPDAARIAAHQDVADADSGYKHLAVETTRPGGAKHGKRFIERYPFSALQREAIDVALAEAGLGDAAAREIFIGAIAYDLALLADALARQAQPKVPSQPRHSPRSATRRQAGAIGKTPVSTQAPVSVLAELATRARAFAAALGDLDSATRNPLLSMLSHTDRYRRAHGPAYLQALASEALRVADAAVADPDPAEPLTTQRPQRTSTADSGSPSLPDQAPIATPKPAPSSEPADVGTRTFIRHAAAVFEQCFDTAANPKTEGPFARALRALASATGIAVPTDPERLASALQASVPNNRQR